MFTIDEDTGEIMIIEKVETMDTPRGQYELVVRATDYGEIFKYYLMIMQMSRFITIRNI